MSPNCWEQQGFEPKRLEFARETGSGAAQAAGKGEITGRKVKIRRRISSRARKVKKKRRNRGKAKKTDRNERKTEAITGFSVLGTAKNQAKGASEEAQKVRNQYQHLVQRKPAGLGAQNRRFRPTQADRP